MSFVYRLDESGPQRCLLGVTDQNLTWTDIVAELSGSLPLPLSLSQPQPDHLALQHGDKEVVPPNGSSFLRFRHLPR